MPIRWKRAEGARPGRSLYCLAVPLAAAVAPVLKGVAVVGVAHRLFQEAVALYPAPLLGPAELGPDVGREAVEQVEECARIASRQSAGKGEGLPAGVGQHPCGDALGGTPGLVFMDLICL